MLEIKDIPDIDHFKSDLKKMSVTDLENLKSIFYILPYDLRWSSEIQDIIIDIYNKY